jgi:hypothetical protein
MCQEKSQCHVSISNFFADVAVTFSCHISKKSTKGGKRKFANITNGYSKKKIAGGKAKYAYIAGDKGPSTL